MSSMMVTIQRNDKPLNKVIISFHRLVWEERNDMHASTKWIWFNLQRRRKTPPALLLFVITVGWTDDGKQKYEYLGYYQKREEAMMALAEYNKRPYDIRSTKMTFSEVYEKWSAERYPKLRKSNVYGYTAAFKYCSSIYGVKFVDLRKSHLQMVVDQCEKGYATLKKIKVLYGQLYYASRLKMIS